MRQIAWTADSTGCGCPGDRHTQGPDPNVANVVPQATEHHQSEKPTSLPSQLHQIVILVLLIRSPATDNPNALSPPLPSLVLLSSRTSRIFQKLLQRRLHQSRHILPRHPSRMRKPPRCADQYMRLCRRCQGQGHS
jgi:hypothetical protein